MLFTNKNPGGPGSAAGVENVLLSGATCYSDSRMDLRTQRLVRVHHIHPALAPLIATLAWQEGV